MKDYMKFGQKLSDSEMKSILGRGNRKCDAQCHCSNGVYCGVTGIPEHQLGYACNSACQNTFGVGYSSLGSVNCYES